MKEKSMSVNTDYGTYSNCMISVEHYIADDSLAIEIVNDTDGCIARITVCLNQKGIGEDCAFVDTNNCPWAEDFIEAYGLGTYTGESRISGFCTYPLYRFNMEELKKYEWKTKRH